MMISLTFSIVLLLWGTVSGRVYSNDPDREVRVLEGKRAESYRKNPFPFGEDVLQKEAELRESNQNHIRKMAVLDHNQGGIHTNDDILDKGFAVVVEPTKDSSQERPKNDSQQVVPLHVTRMAREECIEGYKVDENGICRKTVLPKVTKSFLRKRRKRAEETKPKLSYADVVKYGRNPPKNVTSASVVLTHKPTTEAIVRFTTTPAPVIRVETAKPTPRKEVATPRTTLATKPPPSVVSLPPKSLGPPSTTKAPSAGTIPASKHKVSPSLVLTTAKVPAMSSTTPTTPSPTKRPTLKLPSAAGDINQAFLSGEKASVLAQSKPGQAKPSGTDAHGKKSPVDLKRLRRSIIFR